MCNCAVRHSIRDEQLIVNTNFMEFCDLICRSLIYAVFDYNKSLGGGMQRCLGRIDLQVI